MATRPNQYHLQLHLILASSFLTFGKPQFKYGLIDTGPVSDEEMDANAMPAKSNLSNRKKAVMKAVESINGPFTAIELWRRTGTLFAGISRATVYRILRQLRDESFIKDVILPHGLRISVRTDEDVYCILECEDCGRFTMCPGLATQLTSAASNADFLPSQAAIYIRGKCREKLNTDRCSYFETPIPRW